MNGMLNDKRVWTEVGSMDPVNLSAFPDFKVNQKNCKVGDVLVLYQNEGNNKTRLGCHKGDELFTVVCLSAFLGTFSLLYKVRFQSKITKICVNKNT